MPKPLCLRTPDRIEPHTVVRFPGFEKPEMVLRVHDLDTGSRLIRTTHNLHVVQAEVLVEVIAVAIPGIGFAVPLGEVA